VSSQALRSWTPAVVAALGAIAVATAGGLLTDIGPWYRDLVKPSWQPPDWLFAPVWTTIFALTALSAVIAWNRAPSGTRVTIALLFVLNGILNVLWSALFFHLKRPDWALIEVPFLWLSVLVLIIAVRPWSRLSAWLLVPYLAWVAFAAWLNFTIVRLNGLFPG
jgi:tryptophan-rich sensory protein